MVTATTEAPIAPSVAIAPSRGRVVVADELGYCWGVRRALDIIQDAAGAAGPIAPIGDVIHNPQVVERLRARGVEGAGSVDEAVDRGFKRVAITAHGMGPHLAGEAEAAGVELVDTTCPLVTKVQRLAQKLVRQGYFLVVYGDSYHPEVRSVIGWAGTTKAIAAKKVADLPWNAPRGATGPDVVTPPRKVAVVSQTTKNVAELMKFANELQALVAPEGGEFRLCNTICEPTSERQNALRRLVERDRVDLILAIGGKEELQHRPPRRGRQQPGRRLVPHRAAGGHRRRLAGRRPHRRRHRRRLDPGRRDRGRGRVPRRPGLRPARRRHPARGPRLRAFLLARPAERFPWPAGWRGAAGPHWLPTASFSRAGDRRYRPHRAPPPEGVVAENGLRILPVAPPRVVIARASARFTWARVGRWGAPSFPPASARRRGGGSWKCGGSTLRRLLGAIPDPRRSGPISASRIGVHLSFPTAVDLWLGTPKGPKDPPDFVFVGESSQAGRDGGGKVPATF